MKVVLRHEDCRETLSYMKKKNIKVDCVLTSPPYNISKRKFDPEKKESIFKNRDMMYTYYNDRRNWGEYNSFLLSVLGGCLDILNENGIFLINLSYANTNKNVTATDMLGAIVWVAKKLNMKIADIIVWKKKHAIPNNGSNKCTRLCEFVFVLCREKEFTSFRSNKKVKAQNKKQKYYDNIYNFFEAPNSDGKNSFNNACFSTDFVRKLLQMYVQDGGIVYDPFGGTGTTCNGCAEEMRGIKSIASEIDLNQCIYAYERLKGKCEISKNFKVK